MAKFEEFGPALRMMWDSAGIDNIHNGIRELGVSHMNRFQAFIDKQEGKKPVRNYVSPDKTGKLAELIKDAIEDVRAIDDVVEEIMFMRGGLIRDIVEMRNAYYPPERREIIARLKKAATMRECKAKSQELRYDLAQLLGFDLDSPRMKSIIDIRCGKCELEDAIYIQFAVLNRPTSAVIIIPVDVDYLDDWDVQRHDDKWDAVSIDWIEGKMVPEMRFIILPGSATDADDYSVLPTGAMSSACYSMEELSDKVTKALEIDVRSYIMHLDDILNVSDVDDFAHWRATRAANAEAARHSKKEQPDD